MGKTANTQEEALVSTVASESALDWLKRLGLRWIMVYFVLYIVLGEPLLFLSESPFPTFLGWTLKAQTALWNIVVPWIGEHIFGHPIPLYPPWDAGERLLNYAQNGIIVVLALLLALAWTSLDRDREREQKFYEGIRILLRFTLAYVLVVVYGLPKLFPCSFFPCLEPGLLMQPFGNLPPYAFMFFFFGYSYAYSLFIGIAETVGGALLLFRRTTTLGALILTAVLMNVFTLDILYGVEVRLLSGNLALMALFLLTPETRRIANVLLGFAVPAVSFRPSPQKRWKVASLAAKALIIALAFYEVLLLVQATNGRKAMQRLPLSGYYEVSDIRLDRQKASAVDEQPLWQMVAIDLHDSNYGELQVRTTTSAVKHYLLHIGQIDSRHGIFYLTRCADADFNCRFVRELHDFAPKMDSKTIVLRYVVQESSGSEHQDSPGSEALVVNGNVDGANVSMRLHHLTQSPFILQRARINFIDPNDYVWSI